MARRLRLRGLIPQLLPELWHGVRPRNRTYLAATAYANRSTLDATGSGLVSSTPIDHRGLDGISWFQRGESLFSPHKRCRVLVVSSAPISASSEGPRHDLAGRVQAPADEDISSTLRYSHDVTNATLSAFPNAQDVLIRHVWRAPSGSQGDVLRSCSLSGVQSAKNAWFNDGHNLFTLRIDPCLHATSYMIGPCKTYPHVAGSVPAMFQIELQLQPKASPPFTSVGRSNNDPIQSVDDVARELVNHLQNSLRGCEFTSVVSWNEAAVLHLEESFRHSKLRHFFELESIKLIFERRTYGSAWTRLHEHSRSRLMGYTGPLNSLLYDVLKYRHESSPTTSENGKEMSSVYNITHSEPSAGNTGPTHENLNPGGIVQLQMHPYLVGISVATHPGVACPPSMIAECFEESHSRRTGTASDLPTMLESFLGVLPSLPSDITDPVKVTISLDPAVVAATSTNSVPPPPYTLELKKGTSSESVVVSVTSDLQACFQLRFVDAKWKNRPIRVQRIVLQMSSIDGAAVDSLLSSPTNTQVRISTEVNHLAARASAIMRKVCKGVKFDDVTVVPGLLAEAVLRAVRPLTTGLKLEQVSLSVIVGDDPVTLTKTVSLTDLGALMDHAEFPSGYLPTFQRSAFLTEQQDKDISKTGFTMLSSYVTSNPVADYEPANPSLGLLNSMKCAFKSSRTSDWYALRTLAKNALERLPEGQLVLLRLEEYDIVLPDIGQGHLRNMCQLLIFSDGDVVCKLYPFTHVSIGHGDYRKGRVTPTLIQITLRGAPSQQAHGRLNAREQVTFLHEVLALKLTAKIDGRVFSNKHESADKIAEVVHDARSELADHITVDVTAVHVGLFEQDEPVPDFSENTNKHDLQPTDTIESAGLIDKSRMDTLSDSSSESQPGCEHAAALEQLLRELDLKLSSITSTSPNHLEPCDKATLSAKSDSNGQNRSEMQRGVVIALGSNVGNRIEEIEKACRAIDADPDMRIVDTSFLYETKPMYVEDQESFVNGACEIETSLSPIQLLDRLQAIERGHGRVKLIDKGPRNIDLDIVLFRDEVVDSDRLIVPHMLMHEREFVLRPIMDLQLMRQWQDPRTQRKLKEVYHDLLNPRTPKTVQKDVQQQMRTVSPLSTNTTLYPRDVRRTTHIMSILNTTPDSFSDGGSNTLDLQSLRKTAASHIAAGATIIDVGGQSSRPNAPDVTPEEEISRVLPAIAAIKSLPEAEGVSISVDTYRAAVAEAAVNAGAHIINDISAGALDPQMLPTVARLGCTYIMMHMRGTPATMQNRENCTYASGLYGEMRNELASSVAIAVASGVRKWRIIVDPGLGFAKDQTQNLRLLRSGLVDNTKMYRRRPGVGEAPLLGMPQLIGCSRKGFIGKITGVEEPKDRIWGTAAAVTASVAAGADIVRVHDVKEMAQVVKMADAIYRPMADVG